MAQVANQCCEKYRVCLQPSKAQFLTETNVLNDALAQGVILPHSCKQGDCGECSAKLVSGRVRALNGELIEQGSILTCQSTALTDLELESPYFPELAAIKSKILPCKIKAFSYVGENILLLTLRLPPKANFDYLAGQYIDLSLGGITRSYSIANTNRQQEQIELHIRNMPNGQMSKLLFDTPLVTGQLMRLAGPKGTFFVRKGQKPLIFIATGTGISSIKAMLEQLIDENDPRRVHLYWGMRYQTELYCDALYDYAKRFPQVHFTPVLSREAGARHSQAYVQHRVVQDFPSLSDVEVYACGSLDMIKDAKKLFMQTGLHSDAFYSDAFTPAK